MTLIVCATGADSTPPLRTAASVIGCPCTIAIDGKRPSFAVRVVRPQGSGLRFVTGAIVGGNWTDAIQSEKAT